MLVIRMQRTGRKGHAQFRVVVQDSRRTPTSGRVVALLGSFNPHTKQTTLNKEKAEFYLKNGAQPSDRVIRLLKSEGAQLPSWVKDPVNKERSIRNIEKLRKNRPTGEVGEANVEESTEAEVANTEAENEVQKEETQEEASSSEQNPKET